MQKLNERQILSFDTNKKKHEAQGLQVNLLHIDVVKVLAKFLSCCETRIQHFG